MSNIDDLDRLVAVFMKQEDEHFSLFNYIQTVNQETDQQLEKTEELEVGDLFSKWQWGHSSVRYDNSLPETARCQWSGRYNFADEGVENKSTCSAVDSSTALISFLLFFRRLARSYPTPVPPSLRSQSVFPLFRA